MLAQLGNISFSHLKGFTEFNRTGAVSYAEHAILDGKPLLQKTGNGIDDLNLTIRLHAAFCNPLQEIEALINARDNGEILPLLWGNGRLEGTFVIMEVQEQIVEMDKSSNVIEYSVSLALKEYVSPSPLQDEQQANKSAAKATGKKKPIAKKKENPALCQKWVTDLMLKIENHGKAIETMILTQGGAMIGNSHSYISHSTAIRKLSEEIKIKTFDPEHCLWEYKQTFNACNQLEIQTGFFEKEVRALSFRQQNESKVLMTRIGQLKAVLRPLIYKTITRKS